MSDPRPNLFMPPRPRAEKPRRTLWAILAAGLARYGLALLVVLANVIIFVVTPGDSPAPIMTAYNMLFLSTAVVLVPRTKAEPAMLVAALLCLAISVGMLVASPHGP